MNEKTLKCYFVEAKNHDEPNGVSATACNALDAKKYAFPYLAEYDVEWIDMRPRLLKNANIDGLEEGHVFEGSDKIMHDALYRNVYCSISECTCPNCGNEYTEVREIYPDVFGCDSCEDKLTKEDINNPYVKKSQKGKNGRRTIKN